MADDLATRRAKLFGVPQGPSQEVVGLMSMLGEAHNTNATLVRLMREMTDAQKAEEGEEDQLISSLRADLSTAQSQLLAMTERCAKAEGSLATLTAEHERMCQEMEKEDETETEPPEPPEIDPAALASALVPYLVSALPKPAQPQPLKAWVLDTKDSMGNPRRVRLTPEY